MGPQHLPLIGATAADVEVWGFNGQPTTECGYSLPILRDKKTDRYCLYSITRPGGWSSRAEIQEQEQLGRVRRLPYPLELPDRSSTEQPVVAWVHDEFRSELPHVDFGHWVPFLQEALVSKDQREKTHNWRFRVDLAVCEPRDEIITWFDEWAKEFILKYDEGLISPEPAWDDLED